MTIFQQLRQQVHQRANGLCEYCLTSERLTGFALEIDHVIPTSLGGQTTLDNLCLACRRCNGYKSYLLQAIDPITQQQVRLFNPRLDVWQNHFVWHDQGVYLVGQTDIGRATVELFHMNDPLIVRARKLWVTVGWHPPVI